MQIHGPTQVHGPQQISAPHRLHRPQQATQAGYIGGTDQLDISREADMASRIREIPDMRTDRVAQIRAEIESGVYETEQKLETAVGRLFDEISI